MEETNLNKKNIIYSNMKKEDIKEVQNLWKNTEGIHLHENGEESKESIEFYLLRNPGISKIVKNERKEVIGAVLAGHDGRRGIIHHLVIRKDYQNEGIGNKLLNNALESLKESGIRKVFLFVLNENNNGIGFYEHLVWQKEDEISVYSKIL